MHPFHPLRGQRVEVLFSRRRGGQVVLACESASLGRVTVFESWTDRVASPARGAPPVCYTECYRGGGPPWS